MSDGINWWVWVPKAGLEPDKEALPDKETAGIKAIAGPEGDKMVTIFQRGTDVEDQGGVSNPYEPCHKTCHIKAAVPISEYP